MNCNTSIVSTRRLLIISGVLSLLSLGGALYLQIFHHQYPCPLCILQRYAYALIAVCAGAGAFTRDPRVRLVAAIGIWIAAAGGLATAVRQLWLLQHPMFNCGFDALQPIVDRLPLAYLLPSVFKVAGFCGTVYPPIFGLSLPAWSLVALLLIVALAAFVLQRSVGQLRQCEPKWKSFHP